MNASLLIQVCGLPLILLLAVLSFGLSIAAILLFFKAKQETLLAAFLPLCFLPVLATISVCLIDLLSSIDRMIGQTDQVRDSAYFVFLLATNLMTVLLGLTASAVPATIAMLGRWALAWQTSGLRLFPERPVDEANDQLDAEAWTNKEADDYLDQLIRPR
ncbi:hypothetical protein LOC67_08525 [Stieleria sp. JC731]|uniref:hypothetical protein n=1 Tax=Pirellulaceae TaxID=2691357 RepID=UPI001E45749D|nr:hypothetical protein [Stieleria sp. JC731]MCC9600604.1 hypothetical protein [Stieleria sp. JC731]